MKNGRKSIAIILLVMMFFSTSGYAFAAEKVVEKPDYDSTTTKIDGVHEKQESKEDTDIDSVIKEISKKIADKNESEQSYRSTKAENGYVAQNQSKKYVSLQSAIDSAQDGDTIKILADIEDEAVTIDPGSDVKLTVDFNGYGIMAETEDVITILSGKVKIIDALIVNAKELTETEGFNTCFSIIAADVTLQNCYVTNFADDSVGYYCGTNSNVSMSECEYIDASQLVDVYPENVRGFLANEDAILTMNDCSAYEIDGTSVLSFGMAYINDSYIRTSVDESWGIVAAYSGRVNVNDGYYYAHTALYVAGINAYATITKGEFVSMYKDYSAIDSFDEGFGNNISITSGSIATPSNWSTYGADKIDVYKNYAAPKTAKANLKKYNSVTFSWAKVAGTKAYKVYYKKASSKSFSLLTTTNKTSITKTGLSPGVKYEFRVYPCDALDRTVVTKYCKGTKYKSTSIYTLKKVATPKVSKKTKSSVTVKWTNISGETGYQISKSTSKTGTNIVSTYKTTSGKSKVIKATKGKTYYYKVRAYALDSNGNKVYGPWSSVKAYKIK